MGTENRCFYVPVRNWVNTGKLQDKQYCYRYLCCFISVYFNVNDELEAAAWRFLSLNDVAVVCSMYVWLFMYKCGVCLRPISGGETLKSVGSDYRTKPLQHQMQ